MKLKVQKVTSEEIEIPENSYWEFGPYVAHVVDSKTVIQVINCSGVAAHVAIHTELSSNDWQPSTQDKFIATYCAVINQISEASGIEHLPLILEEAANAS